MNLHVKSIKQISLAAFVVALFVLIAVPTFADSVAATVNGDKIMQSEVNRRAKLMGAGATHQAALDTLIDEKITLQLAKKQRVYPTNAQIDRRIAKAKKSGEYDTTIRIGRATQQDFRRQIVYQLALFNLMTKGITVTDKEIQAEYNRRKSQMYSTPESVKTEMIWFGKKDLADKAYARIKKGERLTVLAKTSDDATIRASGSSIGWLVKNQPGVNSEISKKAFALKTGEVAAPFSIAIDKKSKRWIIMKVLDRKRGTVTSLSEVKDDIRDGLLAAKGQKKNNVGKMVQNARSKAKITISSPKPTIPRKRK